ncbi:MAG: acyl-CoA thioesterase, partial [Deltaproteobacteria bacterium]|nr:acyl-CoA thioesterase [Deltaproteobacteria bacterium]
RRAGIALGGHEKAFGFPRVEVTATFHAPLYADDEIDVHIRPERMGKTSIAFTLEVFRAETRCISGKVIAVFIGDEGRPIPVPEPIRQALTAE